MSASTENSGRCVEDKLNCRVQSDRLPHHRCPRQHRSHERARLEDCLLVPLDTIEFRIVVPTRGLLERELQSCRTRRLFLTATRVKSCFCLKTRHSLKSGLLVFAMSTQIIR